MPMQNAPYMVKIDELSFDSENVESFVDAVHLGGTQISQPENVYGIPKLTMRMLEFCEGTQALERVMDFAQVIQATGPIRMSSF